MFFCPSSNLLQLNKLIEELSQENEVQDDKAAKLTDDSTTCPAVLFRCICRSESSNLGPVVET